MGNPSPEIPKIQHDTLQEHEFALLILDTLYTLCTSRADKIIIESLQGILYTQKLELLEQHYQRMILFLNQLAMHAGAHKKDIQDSIDHLTFLVEKRRQYLNRWFSYFQFWSSKQWPHLNLLFLIPPLIVGIFVPFVGISMLIFLSIYTALSFADLSVQSVAYWQWRDIPDAIEPPLTVDEQNLLKHLDPNLAPLIARPKEDFFTRRLNDILYYGDIIGIAICLIGIVSFAFPPVGIPVLALSILTGVAIAIGIAQSAIVLKHDAKERAEQAYLKQEITTMDELFAEHQPSEWFQPHIAPQTELKDEIPREAPSKPEKKNWLTHPFTWYEKPKNHTTSQPPEIFKWILGLIKWQNAEVSGELHLIKNQRIQRRFTSLDQPDQKEEEKNGNQQKHGPNP